MPVLSPNVAWCRHSHSRGCICVGCEDAGCNMTVQQTQELERLRTALAESRKDTERLDWMQQNTKPHKYGGLFICVTADLWEVGETHDAGFNGWSDGEGESLRAAIDAARTSEALPPSLTET